MNRRSFFGFLAVATAGAAIAPKLAAAEDIPVMVPGRYLGNGVWEAVASKAAPDHAHTFTGGGAHTHSLCSCHTAHAHTRMGHDSGRWAG